jgi:hypothetical protein
VLAMPEIDANIPLAAIYADVELPPRADADGR